MKAHQIILAIILIYSVILVALIVTDTAQPTSITDTDDAAHAYAPVVNDTPLDKSQSIAQQARSILIKPCGSCHQSSLPTQKAGALSVYDLDDVDNWYKEMTAEEYDGIERRLSHRDQFSEEQAGTMMDFLAYARAETGGH